VSGFPRLDVLPAAQRSLWPQLADVSRHSFVLYGGTAVALYLGHRESVDFDFFTNLPFQPDDLVGSYRFLREVEVLQSQLLPDEMADRDETGSAPRGEEGIDAIHP
jgi:hypothetical protein